MNDILDNNKTTFIKQRESDKWALEFYHWLTTIFFLFFLFFLQFLFHHCSISIHQNYHFLGIRNKKNLVPKWLFWRSMISTFIQSSWIFSHKKIIKESWIKKSSSSQSSPLLHSTTTTTKRKSVGFMSMRAACESLINRNRNWYQWEKNNTIFMVPNDCAGLRMVSYGELRYETM